jgi:hypothetical protein
MQCPKNDELHIDTQATGNECTKTPIEHNILHDHASRTNQTLGDHIIDRRHLREARWSTRVQPPEPAYRRGRVGRARGSGIWKSNEEKREERFWIALLNVVTFPASPTPPMNESARAAFKKWQIDVWGWVELNVNCKKVKMDGTLPFHSRDWFEASTAISVNNRNGKEQTNKQHQWRGTSLITCGKVTHNVVKKGVDDSGLAPWCWMQFTGKNNKSTTIISAYAPHQQTGPALVGSQHRNFST